MITERDAQIVARLHESGGMDLAAIQVMFGMVRSPAYRRVQSLERYGMIAAVRPFLRTPAIYVPTQRGLRELVGRDDLKVPSIGPGSYVHAVQVAHVIAELDHHGVRWQSERTTRRAQKQAEAAGDRMESKRYAIELSWQDRYHLPDVLMWPSATAEATQQPVAIEVELSQKSAGRLDEILQGYSTSLDVAGVVYVAGPHAINAVTAAIARLEDRSNVAQVVSIYDFGPHFAAPALGGRPNRNKAVQTVPRTDAQETWISLQLTDGPISLLEEQLRGGAHATPTLLTDT